MCATNGISIELKKMLNDMRRNIIKLKSMYETSDSVDNRD